MRPVKSSTGLRGILFAAILWSERRSCCSIARDLPGFVPTSSCNSNSNEEEGKDVNEEDGKTPSGIDQALAGTYILRSWFAIACRLAELHLEVPALDSNTKDPSMLLLLATEMITLALRKAMSYRKPPGCAIGKLCFQSICLLRSGKPNLLLLLLLFRFRSADTDNRKKTKKLETISR